MRKAQRKVGKDVSIDEPLQPLLTIADVCRMLSLSRPKIYDLISEGLPVLRFGRAVRFSSTSLQRWLVRGEEIA